MGRTIRGRGKSGIMVTVGFEEMLEKIQKAGGNVEAATWEAARKGAREMHSFLKTEAEAAGVPSHMTTPAHLSFQAERMDNGNRYACTVGWRIGAYDPKNPSVGHKVIFMNYGTPKRFVEDWGSFVHVRFGGEWKTVTYYRGFMDAKGFIGRAKKKARPKVKAVQKAALEKILEELE